MPTWNEVFKEIHLTNDPFLVLNKYLQQLSNYTKRNTIIYYSGWLQKPELNTLHLLINDMDKHGFMIAINGLDRKKGLDLILHTPGGNLSSVESLVDYLHLMFGNDIRAIVPQLAMSGGTMIACSCKSIMMGKHSSLGPIDPQFDGIPAHGIIEEFEKICSDIKNDPNMRYVWNPILEKYPPAFIGDCEKLISWSKELTEEWLSCMFQEDHDKNKIDKIISQLGDHSVTKSHDRQFSISKCMSDDIGLKIERMEDDQKLQDAILTIHHIAMLIFSETPTVKIIQSQNNDAFILNEE
jgi:hypothetical protein